VDTDLDQHPPAALVRDVRVSGGAGGTPELELRLPAGVAVPHLRATAGDDQVYAAAELVRRGLATRVVLVNAPIDLALPADWEIRGTPIHLERRGDGRTVLTAGRVSQR
jgi:hypothetical protein